MIIKGISILFAFLLHLLNTVMPTGIIYNTPHPSPFCEERCDGVSEAGCLTRRSAAAAECCGRSCSHCDVCLVRRSECLGCAVLSS